MILDHLGVDRVEQFFKVIQQNICAEDLQKTTCENLVYLENSGPNSQKIVDLWSKFGRYLVEITPWQALNVFIF